MSVVCMNKKGGTISRNGSFQSEVDNTEEIYPSVILLHRVQQYWVDGLQFFHSDPDEGPFINLDAFC